MGIPKRVDAAKKNGHVYIFYWFRAHADQIRLIWLHLCGDQSSKVLSTGILTKIP